MDPRQTAAAIARVRSQEAQRPPRERLFEDPYAELFDDTRIEIQELFGLSPFFEEHIRLRTRFFDDTVRDAVARGTEYVVLVGAGFDTRSLRMPELRAPVCVIEVDHADQIAEKQRRFARAGVTLPQNLSFAAADVTDDAALARGLEAAGLRGPSSVLWVCEGLLGYLSMPTIEALAKRTFSSSSPGSELIGNHNVFSWSSGALRTAFEAAGWAASVGPGFDDLHRRWIGPSVPEGSEAYAVLIARRPAA